jgi:hypothetical protein
MMCDSDMKNCGVDGDARMLHIPIYLRCIKLKCLENDTGYVSFRNRNSSEFAAVSHFEVDAVDGGRHGPQRGSEGQKKEAFNNQKTCVITIAKKSIIVLQATLTSSTPYSASPLD